jgi:PAS domain-containing protein
VRDDDADWADCLAHTARFLADSSSVAALFVGHGQRVERTNDAYLRMAGLAKSPIGANLSELLAPVSHEAAERLATGATSLEQLSFITSGARAFTLSCRFYREGERGVLVGEGLAMTDYEALRRMSRLGDEVVNLGRDLERRNRELQRALDENKVLRGILPICMYCKRIRDEGGRWTQLELYVAQRSEAAFSHGMCAECEKQHFPDDDEP